MVQFCSSCGRNFGWDGSNILILPHRLKNNAIAAAHRKSTKITIKASSALSITAPSSGLPITTSFELLFKVYCLTKYNTLVNKTVWGSWVRAVSERNFLRTFPYYCSYLLQVSKDPLKSMYIVKISLFLYRWDFKQYSSQQSYVWQSVAWNFQICCTVIKSLNIYDLNSRYFICRSVSDWTHKG